jgi:hypothetical protein
MKVFDGKFVTAERCCRTTREQKEQTTDFVLCRALFVTFSRDEKVKTVRLKEKYN